MGREKLNGARGRVRTEKPENRAYRLESRRQRWTKRSVFEGDYPGSGSVLVERVVPEGGEGGRQPVYWMYSRLIVSGEYEGWSFRMEYLGSESLLGETMWLEAKNSEEWQKNTQVADDHIKADYRWILKPQEERVGLGRVEKIELKYGENADIDGNFGQRMTEVLVREIEQIVGEMFGEVKWKNG